jgi:hypothetical protein
MGTFPPVEPNDAAAVAGFVVERFSRMFPGGDASWLQTVFRDTIDLFEGRNVDYSPIDLHYHDLEHTLQATLCIALLLENRNAAGVVPRISRREFELAVAAALLHDSGYLKLRSDRSGTGAKYTYCHVIRSCAFAATYLPTRGANELEIEVVLGAISCTGPTREMSQMQFREPIGRVIGNALATADFLGQMADPAYPDKLAVLFREFQEADEFFHLAIERRAFQSPADLAQRTPAFWENFVRRKLEVECQALYRFLAFPYPHGPNPYIDAVERNVAEIRRRTTAAQPTIVAK